ncbi:response regulator [Nostoc sp.]|uniref:response regulator n=1 Tax=Nostoc sp. TaxID=1180 RepID=UPI002FF7847B
MGTDQKINQETELNSLQILIGTLILLVEDEPDVADLLIFILEAAGAEVMALTDAEAALALVESLHPDILLCNVEVA